jgi:hypothetical protein
MLLTIVEQVANMDMRNTRQKFASLLKHYILKSGERAYKS